MLALVVSQGQYAILGTVIAGVITILVTLISVKRAAAVEASSAKKVINEIKISVDGRLEAALEKVDALAGQIAVLTGTTAPPPVSGQNVPSTPESSVLADAAAKAKAVVSDAEAKAKEVLAAAQVQPLTPETPTTRDVQGVEVPIVEAPVIVVATPKTEETKEK